MTNTEKMLRYLNRCVTVREEKCTIWISLRNVKAGEIANHEGNKRKVESNQLELELRITAPALEDLQQCRTVSPRIRHQPFKHSPYSPMTHRSSFSAISPHA
jgi:hypothetical protein